MPKRSDPTPMTQWFLEHPWRAAAASGVLIAGWTLMLSHGVWMLALAVGLLMFFFVGLVWREGGPGYRWRQWMRKNFPKDPPHGA
jgi:hypothetical protein